MNKVEAVEQLLHDSLLIAEREFYMRITEKTGQVVLTEFKYEKELTFVFIGACGCATETTRSYKIKNEIINQSKTLLLSSPFVEQISMRRTIFSCCNTCKIFISLRAVIGN